MRYFRSLIALLAGLAILLCAAACSDAKLRMPEGFSVDDENTLSWQQVETARQYEVEIKAAESGETSYDTTRRTSYSLSGLAEGDYEIRVKAVGGSQNSLSSDWSEPVLFHKDFETGLIYTRINQNTEYAVQKVGTAEGSVTIEDVYRGRPVTAISDGAFRASNRITEVIVGGNVRTVGEKAFYNCSALTRVEFPDSVVSIGSAAFQVCNKLQSVRLPAGLTAIPEYLFAYCRSLTEAEIPASVQTIGESAFYACSSLKEVQLPDGLAYVGPHAFSEASEMEKIGFGSGIRMVDENAFYNDVALTEIEFAPLADTLVLGDYAFAGCNALPSVALPEGLVQLGQQVFYQCETLSEVTMPESVTEVGSFLVNGTALYKAQEKEGDDAGFIYADGWLVATTEAVRRSVKRLVPTGNPTSGEGVAYLREGTVGIASNVFINCTVLEQVELPKTVRYLCANSFYGNPVLNRFLVRDDSELVSIGDSAFRKCEILSHVQFGQTLETIGSYAFEGCLQLRNSNIGDIDNSFIPSSVTRIGTYAFYNTALYKQPDDYGIIYAGNWVVGYNADDKRNTVDLKEGVAGIADYAFYQDDALEVITGLNRVLKIGRGAFSDCYSLAQISLNRNLTAIPSYAFRNCASLFNVNFPMLLKSIGAYAFDGCTTLNTVDFSGAVLEEIGEGAFYNCSAMKTAEFGDMLKTVGAYAFYGCVSLQKLEFPDTLTQIGTRAFAMCAAVESIRFGEGLVSIGDFAFRFALSLTDVTLPDSLQTVGNYAFYDCIGIRSINLGTGVQWIGAHAFSHTQISSLVIPESVVYIGSFAFAYSQALSSAVLRYAPVRTIGANAFYGCYFLTFYSDGDSASMLGGRWNSSYCPIVWGSSFSEEGYLVSVTAGDVTNPIAFFGLSAPQRAGYVFAGWAADAAASEAEYALEELLNVPAGTVLYAVWTPSEETPGPELPPADTSDEGTMSEGSGAESLSDVALR